MKNSDLYSKYKVDYPASTNSLFDGKNWVQLLLVVTASAIIGPLLVVRKQYRVQFTFELYLKLAEYIVIGLAPLILLFIWLNWCESLKRRRGYGYYGKFVVTGKQSFLLFHRLSLEPGNSNRIYVDQFFFNQVRIGDQIIIRRDALGNFESISKISSTLKRIAIMQER